jgi:hypothetical protein
VQFIERAKDLQSHHEQLRTAQVRQVALRQDWTESLAWSRTQLTHHLTEQSASATKEIVDVTATEDDDTMEGGTGSAEMFPMEANEVDSTGPSETKSWHGEWPLEG